LENTTIEEIIDVGAGGFEFITAESVIIVLKTKIPSKEHKITVKTKYSDQVNFGVLDFNIKSILQNIFLKQENYNINLNLHYEELEIINFIKASKDCDLDELFEAKTCIATGNDKKFLKSYKVNNTHKKTLRGKNIGRYYIDFNNIYVNYNPTALHRARDESIFLKPEKLIMQTISSNLNVAYDNDFYYPLSTCIAIIPKSDFHDGVNIKYLLLLLNSMLMNFYYDFVFNLSAYLTTEISVNNINRLPLKMPDNYEIFEILSEIIIYLNRTESRRENYKETIEFVENFIDLLIFATVFKDKFENDGINLDLFNLISKYFMKKEKYSYEGIQEIMKNLDADEVIRNEMELIKNHSWVRKISEFFKKN
jgi:hypothetical protein